MIILTRFFFVETSEWSVGPVIQMPEPANAQPETFAEEEPVTRAFRYEKRLEVRDRHVSTIALLKLRSKRSKLSN